MSVHSQAMASQSFVADLMRISRTDDVVIRSYSVAHIKGILRLQEITMRGFVEGKVDRPTARHLIGLIQLELGLPVFLQI